MSSMTGVLSAGLAFVKNLLRSFERSAKVIVTKCARSTSAESLLKATGKSSPSDFLP